MTYVLFLAFMATVPLANWLIQHVGAFCVPNGPCLIPVGFSLDAPSGVLVVGLAFVLRDLLQRTAGPAWAAAAIVCGAGLSLLIAPPALAIASGAAFLVAEGLDMAVYTPLARRRFLLAVAASSLVGIAADSALFLWLAFGSLDYLPGQIVGKLWGVAIGAGLALALRRRAPAHA